VLIGITKEAAIYNKQQERGNIFNNCNKLLIKVDEYENQNF